MGDSKKKTKKALDIILNVIIYAFVVLAVIMVVFTITAKRDADGAINIFGHQMRVVISPSMEKCDETDVSGYKIKDIPVRSMVFIELVPDDDDAAAEWYSKLQVGDVLTFKYRYVTQETITHRIVNIEQKSTGGYVISLEGDNKSSDASVLKQTIDTDESLTSPNHIIGKVTGQSRVLGFLVYSLKQPIVMVLLIIVPCVVIIVLEIIRIVNILSADKKKRLIEEKEKMEEDKQKQASEIEDLKKQLAELKERQSENSDPDDGHSEN